jgi:hypothetical protein
MCSFKSVSALSGRDSSQSTRSLEVRERPASFRLISYIALPAAWCRFRVCLLHAAAPVVCCVLCVASVPCCALVVEYNASRMLLVVRWPLLAAHEMRRCRAFPCCISHVLASSCVSSAVCCMRCLVLPSSARCLLHAACCLVALMPCCLLSMVSPKFHVVCCMLHAACCMLRCMSSAACCLKSGTCCRLRCTSFFVRCMSPAACCMLSGSFLLHAACRQVHFPCCVLHVVCCIFSNACCMLSSVVCCTFSSGRLRHAVRRNSSACPFFVACRTWSAACCLPQFPCRMACAACRLARVASCPVACSALRVFGCLLQTARPLSHLVSCPLPVPSCTPSVPSCTFSVACRLLQSDAAPSHTQRIAAVLAIERRSGPRGPLQ